MAALLISGSPVFVVAMRKSRRRTVRRFFVAAAAIGVFVAAFAAGSARLEEQCRAAGNPTCIDYGFEGFLLVIAFGWVIVTWTIAGIIYRE
jgi:Na+/pantothenate symporter